MQFLIEKFGLIPGWVIASITIFMRYALFAGIAFTLFYIIRKGQFTRLKIQQKFPKTYRIISEVKHSAFTAGIFALIAVGIYFLRQAGYTRIYLDIDQFGWAYLLFSFIALTLIHDTYFYWMHRLMHHPKVFPLIHKVHHYSNNPTPWASLSFHPLEAVLEIGIVPIIILFIPFHPLVLFLFATWSLFWNVLGHLGFELFPKGFVTHPVFKWFNTSTHHNMHHSKANCNYGLYFNFWDRMMNTNHKHYIPTFEQIKDRGQKTEVRPQSASF